MMVCVKVMLALAVCLGFLVGEGAVADCCLGVSTPLGEVCERSYSDTWWVTYKCVDSGGWSQQFELCAECCTHPPPRPPPLHKTDRCGNSADDQHEWHHRVRVRAGGLAGPLRGRLLPRLPLAQAHSRGLPHRRLHPDAPPVHGVSRLKKKNNYKSFHC